MTLDDRVKAVLERQRGLPLSCGAPGLTERDGLDGWTVDRNRIELGQGDAAFERAVRAVRSWVMFPDWTTLLPEGAPIEPGTVVAVVVRLFGRDWINPCRIVRVIDETDPVRRFGFAYATLPAHAESGEERFLIVREEDGRVFYDLRAVSRPGHWWTRIGGPYVRRLQKRFARDSMQAMRRFVQE